MLGYNRVGLVLLYRLGCLRTSAGNWLLLFFCHGYWMSPLWCLAPTWMQIEWPQVLQFPNGCEHLSRLNHRLCATGTRLCRFFDNEPLLFCCASERGTYQGKCGRRVPGMMEILRSDRGLALASGWPDFAVVKFPNRQPFPRFAPPGLAQRLLAHCHLGKPSNKSNSSESKLFVGNDGRCGRRIF